MKKILVLAATLLTMTSCSLIVHGKTQKVQMKSESGKTIKVYDKHGNLYAEGKGSLELNLPRGGSFSFARFSSRENEFKVMTDNETKNLLSNYTLAYSIGNLFVPFGHLIDSVTGASYVLEYNEKEAKILNFK